MKHNKKAFTIIELILIITFLIIISGLFSVNFIKINNKMKQDEQKEILEQIQVAADAYVMSNLSNNDPSFNDIKLTAANEDTYCYIPLQDLVKEGFLNEVPNDINTGQELNGVIKFTHEQNGVYTFDYQLDSTNYLKIIYDKNGADDISRTAHVIPCESYNNKEEVLSCINTANIDFPTIQRKNGVAIGFAASHNSKVGITGKVAEYLEENYDNVDIADNEITLYAISSEIKTATFNKNEAATIEKDNESCTIFNDELTCNIQLPNFMSPKFYDNIGWNTEQNGKGKSYNEKEIISIHDNTTLYAMTKPQQFLAEVTKKQHITGNETVSFRGNIIFVLDASGSMNSNNRMGSLKTVVKKVVEKLDLSSATVSIISHGDRRCASKNDAVCAAQNLISLSQNKSAIYTALNGMTIGYNEHYDNALNALTTLASNTNNGKLNYAIFISDGEPVFGFNSANVTNAQRFATIYTVGVGSSVTANTLKSIASNSSYYYSYNDTGDDYNLTNFLNIFADILQTIDETNPNTSTVVANNGHIDLGSIIIMGDTSHPINVYQNGLLLETWTNTNSYIYKKEDGHYYFDAINYAIDKNKTTINGFEIQYYHKIDYVNK